MSDKLQLVKCSDEGQEETVTDVITLDKNHRRIELRIPRQSWLLATLCDVGEISHPPIS